MIVRPFDHERDSFEVLARLNPFPPEAQVELAKLYAASPFVGKNLLVGEANGKLVGVLHIFDSGFPWAIVDGFYIDPTHRSLENARKFGEALDRELQSRDVPLYMTYAEPRLAEGLKRMGFQFMLGGCELLARRVDTWDNLERR